MNNGHDLIGIANILVKSNLLAADSAAQFQKIAEKNNVSLLQYLYRNAIFESKIIAVTIAQHFNLPFVDLDTIDNASLPVAHIQENILAHHVVPLSISNQCLYLATDDPSKQTAIKKIQFQVGMLISIVIVETDKLDRLVEKLRHQQAHQTISAYFSDANLSWIENNHLQGDAPVIKFVNKILLEAVEKNVSDIHFEPYESSYRIRYRQDGLLHEMMSPQLSVANHIAARMKVMANLDISEKRLPQDGRFKLQCLNAKTVDFRISTCPTIAGEKIVVRILDQNSIKREIEHLGFSPAQQEIFLGSINQSQGMILVTGPTGSGKTVTLYSALHFLNTQERNISTVEDPVEIYVNGINQVHVQSKIELNFPDILRTLLRQDPDVIMVGEIRDKETADIAFQAAQTGHLVLSTLHTNSAVETLVRLNSMGISSVHLSTSINLIIAQRLARSLCSYCKTVRKDLSVAHLNKLGFKSHSREQITLYQANHCSYCNNGYRGRVALFEVMPISSTLSRLIIQADTPQQILQQAQREGMKTLYEDGLEKIKAGITTIEEIQRVTTYGTRYT